MTPPLLPVPARRAVNAPELMDKRFASRGLTFRRHER